MQDSAGQPGRKHREDPGTKRTTTARRLTGKEERISFKDDIPGWYRVLWRWGQEVLTAHLTPLRCIPPTDSSYYRAGATHFAGFVTPIH